MVIEKGIRRREPAFDHFAVAIDKLNPFDTGCDFHQPMESGVARPCGGERHAHVQRHNLDAACAGHLHRSVRGSGVDVDDAADQGTHRFEAAHQAFTLVATDDDDTELTHAALCK